uniref:Uncharacterized protein n=1 Tax=Ditylenchus dipsaci TaxID=166011 RepID=A0A915DXA5_9BILA
MELSATKTIILTPKNHLRSICIWKGEFGESPHSFTVIGTSTSRYTCESKLVAYLGKKDDKMRNKLMYRLEMRMKSTGEDQSIIYEAIIFSKMENVVEYKFLKIGRFAKVFEERNLEESCVLIFLRVLKRKELCNAKRSVIKNTSFH